jgi:small-conductance mechanosensitive channel
MDIADLFARATDLIVRTATGGPYVVPFWAAVVWLVLLFVRRPLLGVLWAMLGVTDASTERTFTARVDVPLQVLLITLASMPFLHLIDGIAGAALEQAARALAAFLALHVVIQGSDLLLVKWYLGRLKSIHVPQVLRFVVLGLIYAVVVLVLLDWALGVDVLPLLATSTVLTAVLGFALQDTLRNLCAGLTISFERTLRQGDWVLFRQDLTGTHVGEIVEIGWRSTKIRKADNSYVIVPNSQLTDRELTNYSLPTRQQARELSFCTSVDADPSRVKAALVKAAAELHNVLGEPPPQAFLAELKPSEAVYTLRFWVDRYEDLELTGSTVFERVWKDLHGEPKGQSEQQFPG